MRWLKMINRGLFIVGLFGLLTIVVCYWLSIVFRYFLNEPLVWTSALISYLLCFSICCALPRLAEEGAHISVDILVQKLSLDSPVYRNAVLIAVFLINAVVCWIIGNEAFRQYSNHTTTALAINLDKYWITGMICMSFGLSALNYFMRLFRSLV